MNRFKRYSKQLVWFFSALLLAALVAGCGHNDSNNSNSGGTVAPMVTSTTPPNALTPVPTNRMIVATFSEAMDSTTITETTFTVTGPQGTPSVSGEVKYAAAGTSATFKPRAVLAINTVYTATITTGAKDLAGNALASSKVWTFKTDATQDLAAPAIASQNPTVAATAVPINRGTIVTFSKAMDPSTINASTFTLTGPGTTPVPGAVTYANTTATFTPASALAANTEYTATITTGAKDLAGNAIANSSWKFTTGTAAAASSGAVVLGKAGDFAILAKTGIASVPPSKVTGNIGVSPAAATFITGFDLIADATNVFSTSTQVVGKVYAPGYAAPTPTNLTTAVGDMETAYTTVAGLTVPAAITELGAGDISGLTLAPGLYKWSNTVLINSNVTLNGSATDVWIFQIAGGITQASATRVILAGGALPKNIIWQSAGIVSIGTTAHMEGVILAKTAITLDTGATINGRLLAQTAVTVNSSTVTQPAP